MALRSAYQAFLAGPTTDALAQDASINYIPTLTSIKDATPILKHLSAQENLVKTKRNFLNVIECGQNLVVETETTLQFLHGGGVYLPGLDDNFLNDRTVTLPMVHIVNYTPEHKIKQVRLFWDQATLLKAVEVIGTRGRGWPVFDGVEQVRLISKSTDGASADTETLTADERQSRRQSRVGANGDKYTSLQLFQNRRPLERADSAEDAVAPRASAKPAPRDYHDLFAAGADLSGLRSPSPTKENANPIKAGAGKHYNPIRLFDEETGPTSPEKSVKTNPKKYEHFDFGEAEFVPKTTNKKDRHGSQWDFSDFVTPEKPRQKPITHRSQLTNVTIGEEDEEAAQRPNYFRPHIPRARPDADAHFEFTDVAPPQPEAPSHSANNSDAYLYDESFGQGPNEADSPSSTRSGKVPLGDLANVNKSAHNKTFGTQFEITDQSPSSKTTDENASQKKPQTKARANKAMEAQINLYDESPKAKSGGIKIAGDGMGSRKTGEKSWWEM